MAKQPRHQTAQASEPAGDEVGLTGPLNHRKRRDNGRRVSAHMTEGPHLPPEPAPASDSKLVDKQIGLDQARPEALARPDREPASAAGEGWIAAQKNRPALQGRVEKIGSATIEGWAWDPMAPDDRIKLVLMEGDTRVATAVADIFLERLVKLGCGDGHHGFSIPLQSMDRLSAGSHSLTLRCADSGVDVKGLKIVVARAAMNPGASIPGPAPPAMPERAFRSNIDKVVGNTILGWVMTPTQPDLRHTVSLREGATVLSRVIASEFRRDVLDAGIGDGCYSFTLPLPAALADGEAHTLDVVEEASGAHITSKPMILRAGGAGLTGASGWQSESRLAAHDANGDNAAVIDMQQLKASRASNLKLAHVGVRVLFDISDLVYYLGHHANLTGIQRVQSSVILSLVDDRVLSPNSAIFLSFDAVSREWLAIPGGYLTTLLRDCFLPESQRLISFPMDAARYGRLPGAQPFTGTGVLDDGNPSVLCLLGAAWVNQDYIRRVLALKRRFGTRFVMTVHDLIPIYARETCDQDTVVVFVNFMQRALRHVDHILAVSESTAKDLRRYLATLRLPEPPMTVTRNGSSFEQFLPPRQPGDVSTLQDLPTRFVLFVATVEGRKNHSFMFDLWRAMVDAEEDPPVLVCVGRIGWRADDFVSALVDTNYLGQKILLLRDISDFDLRHLFETCLFSVFPSLYEGWGLPVGESLAMGKICVSSDLTSIPEVAGECGVYIDIDDADASLKVIRNLIQDDAARKQLEDKIRRLYRPVPWGAVTRSVVAACIASTETQWPAPYPWPTVPFASEVGFGCIQKGGAGTGELVLSRISDAQQGHFQFARLTSQSFLLGEEARSEGLWALTEPWGTWLCQAGGAIEFSLDPEPSSFYYVFIRIRTVFDQQVVSLVANGTLAWQGIPGQHPRDVVLRIAKPGHGTRAWRLRIQAQVEISQDARREIFAVDGRVPMVGFERMIVVPESNISARLDILTKYLL